MDGDSYIELKRCPSCGTLIIRLSVYGGPSDGREMEVHVSDQCLVELKREFSDEIKRRGLKAIKRRRKHE